MDDLRQQSAADLRAGYDGHNRRPLAQTVADLSIRKRRRRVRAWLRYVTTRRIP